MAAIFVVEDGSGLTNSNSYVSVSDANDYDDNYHADSGWDAADNAAKELALKIATQYLDNQYSSRWVGTKKRKEQSLDWPRSSAEYLNGYTIDDNVVPVEVKNATVEAAIKQINGVSLSPDTTASLKSKKSKVGPIESSKEYLTGSTETVSFTVIDDLLNGLTIGGGVNMPLYRG